MLMRSLPQSFGSAAQVPVSSSVSAYRSTAALRRIERPKDSYAMNGMRVALPVMAAVFLSFLIIGMALPVLPLHVHDHLGFGPFVIGVVAGAQFTASLLSRFWAGRLTDTRGAKRAVVLGL